MRLVTSLCAALMLILAAVPATAATFEKQTVSYDDSDIDPLVDHWDPYSSYVGGRYYYCSANSAWGQKCVDVVFPVTKTGAQLPPQCAWVNYTASCGCDTNTMKLTGSCTYK